MGYNIYYNSGTGGTLRGPESANAGDTVTVLIAPETGYEIASLTANHGVIIFNNTFEMPANDVTITASWEKIQFNITGAASPAGGGSISFSKNKAVYNELITITSVVPSPGFKLKSISTSPQTTITDNKFNMPAANITVTATFEKITYNISKTVTPNGSGSAVLSRLTAQVDDEVTITPTPATGYQLKSISTSPAATVTNNKFSMPPANTTVTIVFEKITYTLTKDVTPAGGGTFTLSKNSAVMGDEITVTATPATGYRLKSITTNPATAVSNNKFTMPAANTTVTVTFEKIKYEVSKVVTPSGTGSVTLSKTTAQMGDEVTVTPTPAAGYQLKSITTSPARTVTNNKFTMPAGNVTVTVTFEKVKYAITTTITPSGTGTATLSKNSASIGEEVKVTPEPAKGYKLKSITTSPSRTVTNNKFTMPASAVEVTVTFEKETYTVSKIISPSGGGSAALSKLSAKMGDEVTVTPTPATGYQLKSITVSPSATVTNNKFTMPAGNTTVTIVFEKIKYNVTKTVTPAAGGTASLNKTSASVGDEITVNVTPATGYKLQSITTSPARTVKDNKFTMPASDVAVTVTFVKIDYNIYRNTSPSGAGTVTTNKNTAKMGESVTVSQTPATGYYFDGWTKNPANLTISGGAFTMPAQNVTLTANYLKRSTASVNRKSVTSNGTVTLTITPDKAEYRHKYRLNFGTGMDTGWVSVAANTTSVTISIPDSWADALPNAESKSGGVLTVKTYKSNNTTEIGSYEITGMVFNVRSDLKPTLSDITKSIARTINGTTYANVGNYYIQGKSGVRIQATADGVRGSTITKIESTLSGYSGDAYNKTVTNTTSLDYTTGLLNVKGSISITVKATDSRGRTATKKTTISVKAYSKPSGTLDVWRVDSGGDDDDFGIYAKYTKTNTYSNVGSNSLTVSLKSQNVTVTGPAATGNLLPTSRQTFDRMTEYSIELILTDAFETVTITAKLPTALYIIHTNAGGDRIAFMKAVNKGLSKNGKDTVIEFSDDAQMYIGAEKLQDYISNIIKLKKTQFTCSANVGFSIKLPSGKGMHLITITSGHGNKYAAMIVFVGSGQTETAKIMRIDSCTSVTTTAPSQERKLIVTVDAGYTLDIADMALYGDYVTIE